MDKRNKKHNHLVLVSDPIPTSLAHKILLNRKLGAMELKETLKDYYDFRKIFLESEFIKNDGKLVCVYCGRKDLTIGFTDIENSYKNNSIKNLATVDHINPHDHDRMNPDKCVVACKKCNKTKSDIVPSPLLPIYGIIDDNKLKLFGEEIYKKVKVKSILNIYL